MRFYRSGQQNAPGEDRDDLREWGKSSGVDKMASETRQGILYSHRLRCEYPDQVPPFCQLEFLVIQSADKETKREF
jgi:hypothetical protein